jgi:chromosomal replication initiation ATPase DnaA
MPEQLTLNLPVRPALQRDDFFVSDANSEAVTAIDAWRDWPSRKMLLVGPKGSGKTHLAHVWATDAQAQIIDASSLDADLVADFVVTGGNIALENIDRIATDADRQNAAFHLHNLVLAEGGSLLMTTGRAPSAAPMSLPDLQSRIAGTQSVALAPPDDALLSTVMVKLFSDRQVEVPHTVIAYLAPRIERSFAGAAQAVDALDILALSERRPITRDLARRVMDKLSQSGA